MKRVCSLLIIFAFILFLSASAYANGLSLNSIGARALGMGGAFVGLADDASAIYWNPAGLSNIEGKFAGFYLTDIIPLMDYSWSYPAFGIDIAAEAKTNHYTAPNFFASYQVHDWNFGLGVFIPAGIGIEWIGEELAALSAGTALKWQSRIGVVNIAPAVSYKISEQFSLGVAINMYRALFELERAAVVGDPPNQMGFQYNEDSDGWGYGVTLGALYDVNEMFRVGFSFRTKTDITMSGTAKNLAFAGFNAPESDFDRDVSWPMWIAGGLAFRPCENLTFTFDLQYSQWSESEEEFVTEYKNEVWKQALEPTGDNLLTLKWEDATQIRFGIEYNVSDVFDLRAGYYYDPAPSPDETLVILFPSGTYNTITAGFSYFIDRLAIDLGVEYLLGGERDIADDLSNPANPLEGFKNEQPGKHQIDILSVSVGLGYSF